MYQNCQRSPGVQACQEDTDPTCRQVSTNLQDCKKSSNHQSGDCKNHLEYSGRQENSKLKNCKDSPNIQDYKNTSIQQGNKKTLDYKSCHESPDPAVRELYSLWKNCQNHEHFAEITQRLEWILQLTEDREDYCREMTTKPSKKLETISNETLEYPFQKAYDEGKTVWNLSPSMMTGHLEGKFLQSLVSMSNAKTVLEIGTFTGYAALAMAEVLPDDGTVTTCEIDPFLEPLASEMFAKSPHGRKITIRLGPAKQSLQKMVKSKERFDFIFVDGDKPGYIDYFKIIMDQGLLSPNGTLVLDNAMMFGGAYVSGTCDEFGIGVRRCMEYLKTRNDIFKVIVPIRDGVVLVRRKADVFEPHD